MIEILLQSNRPPKIACVDVTQEEKDAMLAELDFLHENLQETLKVTKEETNG